jgi:hypothetical protein
VVFGLVGAPVAGGDDIAITGTGRCPRAVPCGAVVDVGVFRALGTAAFPKANTSGTPTTVRMTKKAREASAGR